MGPDRDAGVVPTQVSWGTGGDPDGAGLSGGAPAAVSSQTDPPTLQLPPVSVGPEHRTGRTPDDRRRPGDRRQQGRDRRQQARDRRQQARDRRRLEQEREQQEQEREQHERERRRQERAPRSHRGLKRAIWATAAVLTLAVGALVATEVHTWHVFNSGGSAAPASAARHPSDEAAPAALKPVSIQGYSAAYEVTASSFSVTVSTDRPTWVEARAGSAGATLYAGELPAGASKQLSASGPLWLQVGAGGSTLVVRTGGKAIGTLRPLLAPWQVTFTPSG